MLYPELAEKYEQALESVNKFNIGYHKLKSFKLWN